MPEYFIFSKTFPISKEQIPFDDGKSVTGGNSRKISKKKEETLIKKETDKIKGFLEYNRLEVEKKAKTLDENKHKWNSTAAKLEKDYWKLPIRPEPYDIRLKALAQMRKNFYNDGLSYSKKNIEEKTLHVSTAFTSERKGSLVDVKNYEESNCNSVCRNIVKNKICSILLERFTINKTAESDERETQKKLSESPKKERVALIKRGKNFEEKSDDRRVIVRAWNIWRVYTFSRKAKKKEKMIYENKIESFLAKLKNKNDFLTSGNAVSSLQKTQAKGCEKTPTSKPKQNYPERMFAKQNETAGKDEEKRRKFENLIKSLKASQRETLERVMASEKENKLKRERKLDAPKFLMRMEKRAAESQSRRKEIRERKKKREEEQENFRKEQENFRKEQEKEAKAEEYERKRRRKIELREKRETEQEKKEKKEKERAKLESQLRTAQEHYRKALLRSYGLGPWASLMRLRFLQEARATEFERLALLRKAFVSWKAKARFRAESERKKVDGFICNLLQKKYFKLWLEHMKEKVKKVQVADDWHDFSVVDKFFRRWLDFVQEEQLDYLAKLNVAEFHHTMKIKKNYFKKWKSYPEMKKQIIAKEKQKRIWREKVREILPDFEPITFSKDF